MRKELRTGVRKANTVLESLRAFEQRNHWGATAMTTQMEEDILTPDDRDFVTALAGGLEVILAFDSDNRA